MSQQQAIIFDLGGVLVREAESNLHKAKSPELQKLLAGNPSKIRIFNRAFAFATLFCGAECKTDWILGKVHGADIVAKIHEHIDQPEWAHFFAYEYEKELIKHGIPFVIIPELLAELSEIIEEGADFVRRCKASGAQVAVISNWDPYSWEFLKHKMPALFELFPDELLIIPQMVGAVKPMPGIYEYAAQKLNALPSHCFFVDDSAANVAGAEKCGMMGIHFKNWQQTDQELVKRSFNPILYGKI